MGHRNTRAVRHLGQRKSQDETRINSNGAKNGRPTKETEEEKHKMNEERLAKVPRLRKEQGTEKDKMKEQHMEGTRKVKGKCYEHHIDED